MEEAAAARKLSSSHKEGRNRKPSIRYTSDPCREEEYGVKGPTSEAIGNDDKKLQSNEMELKCLLTDEADYLQPKSSRAANYLDVVEGWENIFYARSFTSPSNFRLWFDTALRFHVALLMFLE